MKLLVLGGTVFLGRHIVETALARGHQVTLFNRGQHNPELFPEVEKLRGNRDGHLEALHGRRWDAAIDTCGYVPRVVRASAELLAHSVEHYTFISSISVYADFSVLGLNETAPLGRLQDETVEEITGETYGPLKALCEQAAERAMPGRVLIIRPGLIVGPHDPTDRFTYWPYRVAQGGEVLAPGRPDRPVQIIDVRDLAEWIVRMVETGKTGTYNATGPDHALTMGQLLETCKSVSRSDAIFTWVDEKFLLDAGVQPWTELPLWVPDTEEYKGFSAVDCTRAILDGLSFRPLAETVQDVLAWVATRPSDALWQAGLAREKEQELLHKWHSKI
ncbi:MAG: SDR family oxidoreductase [Candidatus Bipolaricaulota bacterium]|nr:SDR family oxidoreductase [Candidatus Bipolaricaulota bacterium]